jgi:hypothetical protein
VLHQLISSCLEARYLDRIDFLPRLLGEIPAMAVTAIEQQPLRARQRSAPDHQQVDIRGPIQAMRRFVAPTNFDTLKAIASTSRCCCSSTTTHASPSCGRHSTSSLVLGFES